VICKGARPRSEAARDLSIEELKQRVAETVEALSGGPR